MITLGMDEVGRGCLAGPLVVGAVILDKSIKGLKDSKLLTRKQREKFVVMIEKNSAHLSLGWVWPQEIDELGLTKATTLAMNRALIGIGCEYDEIVIDGKFNFLADNPKCKAIVKADNTVPCVSAASIIAKVARDKYMISVAQKYPKYSFETNVGYGTGHHIKAIQNHGLTDMHRMLFKPVYTYGPA